MSTDKERLEATKTLIACPFCKATNQASGTTDGPEVIATHSGTDWVECQNCGAQGPNQIQYGKPKGSAKRAAASWNAWLKNVSDALEYKGAKP